MRITSEVFNGIAKAVKGFLDVWTPVLFIKIVLQLFPLIRIMQIFAGRGKGKGTFFIKWRKSVHILSFELVTKNIHGNEKITLGFSNFPVLCKTSAGDDTVHVYMVVNFLIPCVKNLNNPRCCAEPLLIRRQFQKCFGAASVKEIIQKLLVTVNERIQFMRKSKYHMEIRRVNDLSPALIHPDFLLHSLTVGAVTVAAGIIVKFNMTAFWTPV